MKRVLHIFAFCLLLNTMSYAQIKVASNNSVGIGTDNPISKLSVGSNGDSYSKVYFYNSNTGASQRAFYVLQETTTSGYGYSGLFNIKVTNTGNKLIGLYSQAYASTAINAARTFGGYFAAGNATSGYNYGIYSAIIGTSNGAALYTVVPGRSEGYIPGMYAAYLRGQVYIEDSLHVNLTITCQHVTETSDRRLKRNLTNLPSGNLAKISQLQGVTYNLISKQDYLESISSNAQDTSKTILPKKDLSQLDDKTTHIGFVAQDLQKIFPELVSSDKDGILGVDYSGMIPVLVEAIKEQQIQIENLKKQVVDLQSKVK